MIWLRVIELTSLKAVANDIKILPDTLFDEGAFARASHSHYRHNHIGGTRSKLRGMERGIRRGHGERCLLTRSSQVDGT